MAQVTWSSSAFQTPAWMAEELTPEKLLPGGARLDAAQFPAEDQQTLTLVAGAIAAGTRTLTLTAPLTHNIPAGTILDFGAGEFCTLTTGATKGSTTIASVTVAADLEGGESFVFRGVSARKPVDSGILVGRTFTERNNGAAFGPADVATPDDQIFLVAFGVTDAALNPDVTLLRHGTLVYENLLPNWATLGAGAQAAIRAHYQCIRSA